MHKLEIENICSFIGYRKPLKETMIITRLSGKDLDDTLATDAMTFPVNVNLFSTLIVLEGKLSITIDYNEFHASKGDGFHLVPHHLISGLCIEKDCRFILVSTTPEVINRKILNLLRENTPSDISATIARDLFIRKNPRFEIGEEDLKECMKQFSTLESVLEDTSKNFHTGFTFTALLNFILTLAESMQKRVKIETRETSGRTDILKRFLKDVAENVKRERKVQTYAEKLFVTPQYLCEVIKKTSGKTAKKWINIFLANEATSLLKSKNYSVQEVAIKCGFPDQSSFGKFIKRETGRTPKSFILSRKQ